MSFISYIDELSESIITWNNCSHDHEEHRPVGEKYNPLGSISVDTPTGKRGKRMTFHEREW